MIAGFPGPISPTATFPRPDYSGEPVYLFGESKTYWLHAYRDYVRSIRPTYRPDTIGRPRKLPPPFVAVRRRNFRQHSQRME